MKYVCVGNRGSYENVENANEYPKTSLGCSSSRAGWQGYAERDRVWALGDNAGRHEIVSGLAGQAKHLGNLLLPGHAFESAGGHAINPEAEDPDGGVLQLTGLHPQPGDRATGSSGCVYEAVRVVYVSGCG